MNDPILEITKILTALRADNEVGLYAFGMWNHVQAMIEDLRRDRQELEARVIELEETTYHRQGTINNQFNLIQSLLQENDMLIKKLNELKAAVKELKQC